METSVWIVVHVPAVLEATSMLTCLNVSPASLPALPVQTLLQIVFPVLRPSATQWTVWLCSGHLSKQWRVLTLPCELPHLQQPYGSRLSLLPLRSLPRKSAQSLLLPHRGGQLHPVSSWLPHLCWSRTSPLRFLPQQCQCGALH